jgi:hypothetical protein
MNNKFFRIYKVIAYVAIFAVTLICNSCHDNKEKEPDPLVGNYIFSGAVFEETVSIKIQDVFQTFDPGSDASAFVSEGMLGAAPCVDSTNAAIAFRADGKSFYICLGETNESQMGTWIINSDRTMLTLYIGNPMAFALEIGNLNLTETVISGTVENFPLPLTTAVALGVPFGDPPTPNIQVKEVTVEFTRIE